MTKIRCPNCKRILGDTSKSIDCNLNCRWCKKPVKVRVVTTTTDYFKKGDKND